MLNKNTSLNHLNGNMLIIAMQSEAHKKILFKFFFFYQMTCKQSLIQRLLQKTF